MGMDEKKTKTYDSSVNERLGVELARTVSGSKTHLRYIDNGWRETICGVRAPIRMADQTAVPTCHSCYSGPREEEIVEKPRDWQDAMNEHTDQLHREGYRPVPGEFGKWSKEN
jgi:hypothetical protein